MRQDTMWVPYSLAARLLVREVSLERCVLVPHASELAFFPVGGRRRSGPEFRRKTIARLGALEVVARARRRRGATRAWWRQVATRRRRRARAWCSGEIRGLSISPCISWQSWHVSPYMLLKQQLCMFRAAASTGSCQRNGASGWEWRWGWYIPTGLSTTRERIFAL